MKNISFFVSSTFNDMQSERDLIREKIAPELSLLAAKYGYSIDFIDLRWGINTKDMSETEANRKILQTCFDEIQKSRPFFVALLGERYGWIPDSEDVISAYQSSAVDVSDEDLDKSITELEIECALRSFPFMDRSLFYFREPIDYGKDEAAKSAFVSTGKERKKLELLKKRIASKYPTQTFNYHGSWDEESQRVSNLDNLERSLIEHITRQIENELAAEVAPKNAVEESVNVTDSLIDSSNVSFAGRVDELKRISEFLHADGNRLLVLSGNSGCGKSSLMAKAAEQASQNEFCVLPFFTGCHERALTAEDMVRATIWRIGNLLGMPEDAQDTDDSKQLLKRFYELLNLLSLNRKVVLLVDAINQFAATPLEENLSYLNLFALNPSVKIILSTTPDYARLKQIRAMGATVMDVDYFSDADVAEVTQRFFQYNHRQVNDALVSSVVNKGQGVCRVPVYLMTLLNELNCIGREDFAAIRKRERERGETAIDAILNYLTEMVVDAPEKQDELLSEFLANAKQKVGDVCDLFVSAIALSRRGLSERLVERICKKLGASFETADFSYFRKLFSVHLVQRENGAWDFNHLLVKNSFLNSFSTPYREKIVNATISALCDEDDDSPFKKSEYAYYLALANRLDEFVPYFVQLQNDEKVQKSLLIELQDCENRLEIAEKMLFPTTDSTAVIRTFIVQKLADGQLPFALGERLIERVLNSIYSENGYFSHPRSLKEIFFAYCALGNAAASAGYFSLAKDYLLMAVDLSKKVNEDSTTLYEKIAESCHSQGQTLSARRYQSKSKRALLSLTNPTVEQVNQLLSILAEECKRKIDSLVPSKKSIRNVIAQMQNLIGSDTLPLEDKVRWATALLKFAASAAITHAEVENEVQICKDYAASADDGILKADALFAVALTLSKQNLPLAKATAEDAHQCVKRALNATVDGSALKLLSEIAELRVYFARVGGQDCRELEQERMDSLAQLNSIAPSYDTLRQYVVETKGNSQVRKDAVKLYHTMSRGQKSTEQKSADKIIAAVFIGVFVVYLVAMPLLFSLFRGFTNLFITSRKKGAFEIIVNNYLDFVFESFLNMLICFFAYGLMQLLKPKTDYVSRKRWAIRCGAMTVGSAVWILAYRGLEAYFSTRVLYFVNISKKMFAEIGATASGLLLIMMLLNGVVLLLSRERRINPAQKDYRRFVDKYPARAVDFAVEMALLAAIGITYWVSSDYLVSVEYMSWTAASVYSCLPILYFIIAFAAVAMFTVARFARLSALYFRRRKQTKEQKL